jgi:hypothetical protein
LVPIIYYIQYANMPNIRKTIPTHSLIFVSAIIDVFKCIIIIVLCGFDDFVKI